MAAGAHLHVARAAVMYDLAGGAWSGAGREWCEVSTGPRRAPRSRHNLAYWLRESYEAVGPGAHAFDGSSRRWNAARLDAYVAALTPAPGQPPRLPPGGAEAVDAAMAVSEQAILGLRTSRGISSAEAARPPVP